MAVGKQKERAVGIIPVRMGSSRFPGKPLATILGIPMVEHVYHRTAMCDCLDAVYVATCDIDIYRTVEEFGGRAIMTSPRHERASERVAEAAHGLRAEIIVMVQGDEPMTLPKMIQQALSPMQDDTDVECVNLVTRIKTADDFHNPNTIKVVMDRMENALYFSREAIPSDQLFGLEKIPILKQVCVIPFRRNLLLTYAELEPTPLEQAESVDMLRLLEYGYDIRLVETEFHTYAVDTPEDLAKVEELMGNDPLTYSYSKRLRGDAER